MHVPEKSLIWLWLGIILCDHVPLQIVGNVAVETEVEAVRLVKYFVQLLGNTSLDLPWLPYAHRIFNLLGSQIGCLLCGGFDSIPSALDNAPCLIHALEEFGTLRAGPLRGSSTRIIAGRGGAVRGRGAVASVRIPCEVH